MTTIRIIDGDTPKQMLCLFLVYIVFNFPLIRGFPEIFTRSKTITDISEVVLRYLY